jgi:hypothetical protein
MTFDKDIKLLLVGNVWGRTFSTPETNVWIREKTLPGKIVLRRRVWRYLLDQKALLLQEQVIYLQDVYKKPEAFSNTYRKHIIKVYFNEVPSFKCTSILEVPIMENYPK